MRKKLLVVSILFNVLLMGSGLVAVHKLGGFRYLFYKMKNRGLAGTYAHRKNLFEVLPERENGIIFLGNSLTEQCEWSELFGNPRIQNRGIAGELTEGLRERLDDILRLKPAKIFLMVGINDLLVHSRSKILKNYHGILDTINNHSPKTEVFVQSILPVNNKVRDTGIENADILHINREIKKIARSKKLIFIDLYPLLIDGDGNLGSSYTKDGIHLNGSAYLVWKKAIEEFVME